MNLQEGVFRVFLTTDLTHAAIVERSAPIRVTTNREYHLGSFFSTVFPCPNDVVRPLTVRRPECARSSDKIRVYGHGKDKDLFLMKVTKNGVFLLRQKEGWRRPRRAWHNQVSRRGSHSRRGRGHCDIPLRNISYCHHRNDEILLPLRVAQHHWHDQHYHHLLHAGFGSR